MEEGRKEGVEIRDISFFKFRDIFHFFEFRDIFFQTPGFCKNFSALNY